MSLCRVFYIGHLANTLPRAETDARRKKVTRRSGDGHGAFVECPGPDTRQTCHLCRVSNPGHSANLNSLPSVKYWTLGKDGPRTYKCWHFAECHSADTRQISHFSPRMHIFWPCVLFAECFYPSTRQNTSLPSVTLGKAIIYSMCFIVRSRIMYHTQINITGITYSS